jgi:hypothetical protein
MVAVMFGIAFLANFPGAQVPHASRDDKFNRPRFAIETGYDHGWPMRYLRRERANAHPTPVLAKSAGLSGGGMGGVAIGGGPPPARAWNLNFAWEPWAWQPWAGVERFEFLSLAADIGFWLIAILSAALAAQYWRSQRRGLWQLRISDLLVLVAAAGLVLAWISYTRREFFREQSLLAEHRQRTGSTVAPENKAACVPGYIPRGLEHRYRQSFERVAYFYSEGHSDIACQFRHLVTLREPVIRPTLPQHLRSMRQLEAVDFGTAQFPFFDVTRQATLLRDFPPLPNLRCLNLADTNVQDADLVWLQKCPRLELIALMGTGISDRGLDPLCHLPRLESLALSSDRLTDHGCESLARIQSLHELSLASVNIHDAGVQKLARLSGLRVLRLTASASPEAFADLKRQLPGCKIDAAPHWRPPIRERTGD